MPSSGCVAATGASRTSLQCWELQLAASRIFCVQEGLSRLWFRAGNNKGVASIQTLMYVRMQISISLRDDLQAKFSCSGACASGCFVAVVRERCADCVGLELISAAPFHQARTAECETRKARLPLATPETVTSLRSREDACYGKTSFGFPNPELFILTTGRGAKPCLDSDSCRTVACNLPQRSKTRSAYQNAILWAASTPVCSANLQQMLRSRSASECQPNGISCKKVSRACRSTVLYWLRVLIKSSAVSTFRSYIFTLFQPNSLSSKWKWYSKKIWPLVLNCNPHVCPRLLPLHKPGACLKRFVNPTSSIREPYH